MKICSIDPGLTGSIVIYNDVDKTYNILYNYTNKNEKGKNELNTLDIITFLQDNLPDICMIEQQIPIPYQSNVATGTTMKNYGIFLGILDTLQIKYDIIFSKTWMKYFIGNLKYTKELGAKKLLELLPSMKNIIYTPRGKLLDGKVDAILMNIYYYNKIKGCNDVK